MTPTNNPSGDLERVSVPREPTEAMIGAGAYCTVMDPGWTVSDIYRAMIAAAPAPSGEPKPGEVRTVNGQVRRFIEHDDRGEVWEIIGAAPPPARVTREEVADAVRTAVGHFRMDQGMALIAADAALALMEPRQ